jgi:hypothetical protein
MRQELRLNDSSPPRGEHWGRGDRIAPKPIPPEFLACVETVLTAQCGEAKKLLPNKPLYSQS